MFDTSAIDKLISDLATKTLELAEASGDVMVELDNVVKAITDMGSGPYGGPSMASLMPSGGFPPFPFPADPEPTKDLFEINGLAELCNGTKLPETIMGWIMLAFKLLITIILNKVVNVMVSAIKQFVLILTYIKDIFEWCGDLIGNIKIKLVQTNTEWNDKKKKVQMAKNKKLNAIKVSKEGGKGGPAEALTTEEQKLLVDAEETKWTKACNWLKIKMKPLIAALGKFWDAVVKFGGLLGETSVAIGRLIGAVPECLSKLMLEFVCVNKIAVRVSE